MAIILDSRLEAAAVLKAEGLRVIDKGSLQARVLKPIRICLLNLLPEKPQAETEWARGLAHADYDVELTLCMVESHVPKHTSPEYLQTFYTTPAAIKDEYFDGLIITGADAEKYPFTEVKYWKELEGVFSWADSHVNACYFSCWGSMAAMYHYYGIDKELIGGKLSGIFSHTKPNPEHKLLKDIPTPVYIPHSRISRSLPQDIYNCGELKILADNERIGPALCVNDEKRHVYIIGHWEYELNILENQYKRDSSKGFDMEKPENYYDDDGNIRTDHDWVSQFHTMMANWVRYFAESSHAEN
ncbi:MAG: homoserine O-succinyltransferase [Clostridia bacterium]|nr:homoserine O-succinyltransferase [Clostridia bacterium]